MHSPLEHGIAARLWIPYEDAVLKDVRVNGHRIAPSATDGYMVKHGPGTIVQFNIPPPSAEGIFFLTCEYETETRRKKGFAAADWHLA